MRSAAPGHTDASLRKESARSSFGKTQYGEVVLGRELLGESSLVGQRSEETLAALTHRRAAQEGERVRVAPGKMTYWKKQ